MPMTVYWISRRATSWRRALFCGTAIVLALFSFSRAEKVTLLSVSGSAIPVIKEKQLRYTMNFLFDRCPQRVFSYQDRNNKLVVIEFFDAQIAVQDSIGMTFAAPVLSVDIKNTSTPIVLSGRKSQFFISLKEEMFAEVRCNRDTLRLELWKDLSPGKAAVRKKRNVPLVPLLLLTLCLGVSYVFFHNAIAGD